MWLCVSSKIRPDAQVWARSMQSAAEVHGRNLFERFGTLGEKVHHIEVNHWWYHRCNGDETRRIFAVYQDRVEVLP